MRTLPLLTLAALAACGRPEPISECPSLPEPTGDVVTTSLPIALFAGDELLELAADVQTETGIPYRVQKLRMYVSEVELVRADGSIEPALLVDGSGEALGYGVHLVDAADEGSLALSLQAPRGTYAGLNLTIGVPPTCPDGETELNHTDASKMLAPLDVDSDMYWSWNPGYVFFKIEGRTGDDGFFYHVGGDDRLARIRLDGEVVVEDGTSPTAIAFDANRLFVTPSGAAIPRLDGDEDDREVHSGDLATQLMHNLEGSHVLELL